MKSNDRTAEGFCQSYYIGDRKKGYGNSGGFIAKRAGANGRDGGFSNRERRSGGRYDSERGFEDKRSNKGLKNDKKRFSASGNGYNGAKGKFNENGIKLSNNEYAKFNSSVNSDYYSKNKSHSGLQHQSCVFNDKHILYIIKIMVLTIIYRLAE